MQGKRKENEEERDRDRELINAIKKDKGGRTTKDERGKKGREGKGEYPLDLLTAIAKKLRIIYKKLQSLDPLEDSVIQIPTPLQILNTPRSP